MDWPSPYYIMFIPHFITYTTNLSSQALRLSGLHLKCLFYDTKTAKIWWYYSLCAFILLLFFGICSLYIFPILWTFNSEKYPNLTDWVLNTYNFIFKNMTNILYRDFDYRLTNIYFTLHLVFSCLKNVCGLSPANNRERFKQKFLKYCLFKYM